MQSSNPRSPNAPATRACINCQRRKSRCRGASAGNGPCSYCARTGKACSFEDPPDRTPLTRKNLDAAEHRCTQLRALLRSLHPDLDIDSALRRLGLEQDASKQGLQEIGESTPHHYEWHECSLSPGCKPSSQQGAMATDGMATLSTTDSGYLGSSSGSQILEEIDPVFTNAAREGYHRASRRPHAYTDTIPDLPSLPVSDVTNHLIDAYFLLFNACYPILHEKTFRDSVIAGQHLHPQPWRVTYYMVLAIGHWVSSTESEHMDSTYYAAAKSNLSLQMLESGTVETVQAFLLLGNYLQKRDQTNTGYNFIGLAYRMALGLGLHRDLPGNQDTLDHERRRQLFWTIYCFESGFNITTGRPPTMADGFIDTRLPRNVDDKDLSFKATVPKAVDYPTTYSAIIAQAELAKIADGIYREFLLEKTAGSKIEYRLAESMERDLVAWRKSLPRYFTATEVPAWFRGPRSVVLWKEQNLRILLWRGSQKHHKYLPTKANSEEKCLDVAMQSIHDIASFCMKYDGALNQGLIWYATYFLFQATLVLVASSLDKQVQSQSDQEDLGWKHSVARARDCLMMLAERNKSAHRCLGMLHRIRSRFGSFLTTNLGLDQNLYHLLNPQIDKTSIPPVNYRSQIPLQCTTIPSENDFALYGESHLGFNDDPGDPSLHMFFNQTALEFLENMPLDMLLNDRAD
ncbi:Fc.00g000460.m01.CDS01 [Cosmosporella sp. VM-42]